MRLLILLFLVGITCATPLNNLLDEEELIRDILSDLGVSHLKVHLPSAAESAAEEDESEEDKKLRNAFDEVLQKIKDALDHRKIIREDVLRKFSELRQQMNERGLELVGKGKELLDEIKERAKELLDKAIGPFKDVLQKLLERLGLSYKKRAAEEDESEEDKKLRNAFDEVLQKIKDALDHRKIIREDVLRKFSELRQQMKERGLELVGKGKELLDQIKERAKELLDKAIGSFKDVLQKLLERLGLGYKKRAAEEDESEEDKKLRNAFDEVLQKIKDALDHRKIIREDVLGKFSELRQQMKERGLELVGKGKELLDQIKERAKELLDKAIGSFKDVLQKLLERLGLGYKKRAAEEDESEEDKKLRNAFDEVLQKIKDALDHRKIIREDVLRKFSELRQQMKERGLELVGKGKELLDQIKERAKELLDKAIGSFKDVLQKLLERLGLDYKKRAAEEGEESEEDKKLRNAFDEVLQKIKDALDHRKIIREDVLRKFSELRQQMKERGLELVGKGKELLDQIKERAKELLDKAIGSFKDVLQKLLERLGLGYKKRAAEEGEESEEDKKLRNAFDEVLQKIKDALDHRKIIREDVLRKFSELRQQMKERGLELVGKGKELLDQIKERAKELLDKAIGSFKDVLQKLLERLGLGYKKRSADDQDIKEKIKEAFHDVLEKIKNALDQGKAVKDELLQKLAELKQKLKEHKIELGEKAKNLLKKIEEKAKDFLKKLRETLGIKDKEARSLRALDLREKLRKIKEAILERFDVDALKEKIEHLIGKGNELARQLLDILKEKGETAKSKILDVINRILGKDQDREERSIADKVKEFFDKLKIQIKEKYFKFGEWVKNVIGDGVSEAKSTLENIKKIAQELKERVREAGKDVAAEGLEFLRPYKEDLGTLWDDLKKEVKEVLSKKD